jgi:hypothetical protein
MHLRDLLSGLSGEPAFEFFPYNDVNPVSGRHKIRELGAPNPAMGELHDRLVKVLRSDANDRVRDQLLRRSTCANPGNSAFHNVCHHRHNRYFYLVDFSSAYGSVSAERLAQVLCRLPTFQSILEMELVPFLERYCFAGDQGLVQGGGASPDLFNLYAGALVDERLAPIVHRYGITYTRYLDDLTFSSDRRIGKRIGRRIQREILGADFAISHHKCLYADLEKQTVVVTGVGIAKGGRLFVPRPYVRRVLGAIHRERTVGDVGMKRVHGMVNHIKRLTKGQGTTALENRVFAEHSALVQERKGKRYHGQF